ncbi:hypothetical+protein [Methylocapsa aurea]|uniref:hypothetical protein n=1 Tax=Methylocapsa aurea TaxID=663610 RepID=UPI003D18C52E
MSDLFGGALPAARRGPRDAVIDPAPIDPTGLANVGALLRDEIIERFGLRDLKSSRAHRCFRCGASTGLAKGLLHRGEALVFACRDHIGEL